LSKSYITFAAQIKTKKIMKVYVLTMTSQLGQGDQPSRAVLGVYSTCEKAEQAYKETTFAESREFVDFYGESCMEKIDAGIIITNPSDDSHWSLIRLDECDIE
jgi:hypothetical protein